MKGLLTFVALLAATVHLPAQELRREILCPHQVIQRVAGEVTANNLVPCGVGVSVTIYGVNYTSPPSTCAQLIVITPAHDTTTFREGSNTYTEPAGEVFITGISYYCKSRSLLWFIPLGTQCTEQATHVLGRLTTYRQLPCQD